jgi:hypothetical protein
MFAGICMFVLHFSKLMRLVQNIPLFFVAGIAWIIIVSSCANQGMPTGGPQDSIPPLLVETTPEYKALNFNNDAVSLTFNEYIIPTEVRETLVISPPMTKRPTIRTKSRTLIVQFNEELLDSVTYSLDFKNSVKDNNEGNEFKNLRFLFSTGNFLDTLRVAGQVTNAFNLETKENVLVLLHSNLHDSAVYTTTPNYIARTDENGIFLMDNIAEGAYRIFSITDNNNDLVYNEGAEDIAFGDTIFIPRAEYIAEQDTMVKGADSMLIAGHTRFYPEPFYLRQFKEDIFEQYLDKYERLSRYKGTFVFNESVKDSFHLEILNTDSKDWYSLEFNENVDSLAFWITDTLVANIDTLLTEISYFQLDTLNELYVQKDTLELIFTDEEIEEPKKKERKDEEEEKPKPIEQFALNTNIGTAPHELDEDIIIRSPFPLDSINLEMFHLFLHEDTTQIPLKFSFVKDTSEWRTYRIKYDWETLEQYTLQIDSAACWNIYGISSKEFKRDFNTRDEDYYGTINLNLTDISSPVIIQLVTNDDKESVLAEKFATENGTVVFDFLPPNKYKVKAILNKNGNKKWDTGSYQNENLPESVIYINEVIKVRSNWDNNYNWSLKPDKQFVKNIRDKELEEQQRKDALEKARQEKENSQRQQNNMLQQNRGLSGPGVMRR